MGEWDRGRGRRREGRLIGREGERESGTEGGRGKSS